MGPLWVEMFRYNKWANLRLLGACATLTEEQLELTAPGTYGTVAATFMHMLAAEQRYLARLGAGQPQFNERTEFPGIAMLAGHATRTADQLISQAEKITPDDLLDTVYGNERYDLHSGALLMQAFHHGNDHRTHICTILGSHGLEYEQMDVWAYAEATGAMKLKGKA
ncbi:MAG: DinB family protein [Candidatus Dormiibacterota bacterium]